MKISDRFLIATTLALTVLSSCNTFNHIQTIDIEVFVPSTILISPNYRNVAVKYNNSNFSLNKWITESQNISTNQKDSINEDSIAFVSYYKNFLETIKKEQFFNSINIIQSENFSGFSFSDSLFMIDSVKNQSSPFKNLAYFLTQIKNDEVKNKPVKYINPELGLYSRSDLEDIADSTSSDILLSLDLLSAFHGVERAEYEELTSGLVMDFAVIYTLAIWNFYDLQHKKIIYQYEKIDTLVWQPENLSLDEVFSNMHEIDSTIIEAATLSGINFAVSLIPHWEPVQRMYYTSGNIELQKTEKLIAEGKWLEAAKIWKANIDNKNKNIAAKSMFNLSLACEMEGDLEAAIDWAVRSYHVFGKKNELHAENCQNYIRILSFRKRDQKLIEQQLNPAKSNSS